MTPYIYIYIYMYNGARQWCVGCRSSRRGFLFFLFGKKVKSGTKKGEPPGRANVLAIVFHL